MTAPTRDNFKFHSNAAVYLLSLFCDRCLTTEHKICVGLYDPPLTVFSMSGIGIGRILLTMSSTVMYVTVESFCALTMGK